VWFDLARGHLREKDGWLHKELIADDSTGKLIPRPKPSIGDLDTAREHLANGDLKASAVYTRSAFEWKLRKICEDCRLEVPYRRVAEKVEANELWEVIMRTQRDREAQMDKEEKVEDFIPATLSTAVEVVRSNVLNKLSHTGSSSLVRAEVAAAIDTVQELANRQFKPERQSPA
jgi:hypothetical protein